MYNSVASLHIALDARIQQQNSNRKTAIMPEQYDMVLNDAISDVLKSRISAKLNAKQQGYEDSVTAYDSLKALKRTCRPISYFDDVSQKWYFELPSDYYMFDALQANINFDRVSTKPNTLASSKFMSVVKFNNNGDNVYTFKKDVIKFVTSDRTIFPKDINLTGTSNKSSFYYFNLIKDYIKSKEHINCYFENYIEDYYNNSLIFVSDSENNVPSSVIVKDSTDTTVIDVANKITVDLQQIEVQVAADNTTTTILMGSKKIDLISSLNDTNETTDFYQHYNRHLNPKCIMQEDKVILTTDDTFNYSNIRLDYVKTPRPIDSRINQMTDIEVTDDILDMATQLLIKTLNLRDPYAEQEAAQQKQQKQ